MAKEKRVLAFDFGASSGRAILGIFDGKKITLKEVHRFSNDPVNVNGTLYWDVLRLFYDIKQGLMNGKAEGGFESIGIDTWGVDFGLIDKKGYLLENPVHYRDKRNNGMIEESEKYMSKDELYDITGIQFMEFNTVFQLLSLAKNRPELLERADKLLMMPDLFVYMLTGEKHTEYSIATTGQLIDLKTNNWADDVFKKLNIPRDIMPDVVKTGSVAGYLSKGICDELSLKSVPVINVAEHDTQSAITAIPSTEKDFIFISCGTWSLFGTELTEPIINEKSKTLNITNEGGYDYSVGFLKNIIGLWLIQESRRQWKREGEDYSYAKLEELALKEEPFKCFIDPDAPEFVSPGNQPERVREFCKRTGQYVPKTVGEIMRCIYESLAMKYRYTFEGIKDCTGKDYNAIHIVGGGTKDKLLCQMTANSCNRNVIAGPIEATVLGNIAVQLLASGDIKDISEARKIIAESENVKNYVPCDVDKWQEAYERFREIVD